MKGVRVFTFFLFACVVVVAVHATSSINDANKHAFGANIGWVNWQGDTNQGAVLGEFYCTGYVYSANAGWICLGNGPTNGFAYSNSSADDWGVNHDGEGNLGGFGYGANIGWVQFEANGAPRINLQNGSLEGYVYGANIGWISLTSTFSFVQVDALEYGPDTDNDGIPDPWEWDEVGDLDTLSDTNDLDGDMVLDSDEYLADTDPNDMSDYLRIEDVEFTNDATTATIVWPTEPSRIYTVDKTDALIGTPVWVDAGYGPALGQALYATGVIDNVETHRFLRVKATRPL